MAILLSGDFHNDSCGELYIIKKEILKNRYKELYDSINYHIILGDGGFLWRGQEEIDKINFKELSKRKFPILCVMGNHEPVYGRKDLPEEDIGIGEKVIVVKKKNPFIAYLKRGKIYAIDGYKILVLGGAFSNDQYRRKEGVSWWKEEYWSDTEKEDMFNLLKEEKKFDFVLSHTGPININCILASMGAPSRHGKENDEVAKMNEQIDELIEYRAWFCGHYHYDFLNDKFGRNKENYKKKYYYIYNYTLLLNKNKLIVNKFWEDEII